MTTFLYQKLLRDLKKLLKSPMGYSNFDLDYFYYNAEMDYLECGLITEEEFRLLLNYEK